MRDKPGHDGIESKTMSKLHWDDFKTGTVAVYGPRLVTREEILAFAAEFDPQPMHLDETAAGTTLLGGSPRPAGIRAAS